MHPAAAMVIECRELVNRVIDSGALSRSVHQGCSAEEARDRQKRPRMVLFAGLNGD